MGPLNAVFRLSLTVLVRSRRTVIMAMICLMPVLGTILGTALMLSGVASRDITGFSLTSFIIVQGYVYVLLLVVTLFYGTALISDELEDKTITYLFMRPVSKATIYLGKYLAYLVAASFLLLPTAAACFLIAMMADPAGEAVRHIPIMLQDLGVLALGILAYGALFSLVGAATNRPIFYGLGFSILWETLVTFIPGYLSKLTIKHYLIALLPHAAGQRAVLSFFEEPTSGVTAILVLLLVSAGLVALGAWSFTHREYVLEQ